MLKLVRHVSAFFDPHLTAMVPATLETSAVSVFGPWKPKSQLLWCRHKVWSLGPLHLASLVTSCDPRWGFCFREKNPLNLRRCQLETRFYQGLSWKSWGLASKQYTWLQVFFEIWEGSVWTRRESQTSWKMRSIETIKRCCANSRLLTRTSQEALRNKSGACGGTLSALWAGDFYLYIT